MSEHTVKPSLRSPRPTSIPSSRRCATLTGAVKRAAKLAGEETLDALAMDKLLPRLQKTRPAEVDDALPSRPPPETASAAETQAGRSTGLAFDFAKDLRDVFQARGLCDGRRATAHVERRPAGPADRHRPRGRPSGSTAKGLAHAPDLVFINNLLKAYDAQHKAIEQRDLKATEFVGGAVQGVERTDRQTTARPSGGRINLVEPLPRSPSTGKRPVSGTRPHAALSRTTTAPTSCVT